jgi:glycosyltransferase involved in cell wall biosynthesis
MIKILHLGWDIPDVFNQKKTKAVLNLIKETENNFYNKIFSFNRTKNIFHYSTKSNEPHHTAIKYFGFPLGIFHICTLKYLYRRICDKIVDLDLVHGHKVTFEGVLCFLSYEKNRIPYVLTLRGDTDFKIMFWLPLCRFIFKKVIESSEIIFCLNPWSAEKLKRLSWVKPKKIVILPNICYVEKFMEIPFEEVEKIDPNLSLVTTFHLDSYKRKRFKMLLRLLRRLSIPFSLRVVGSGSTRSEYAIKNMIQKFTLDEKVELVGFKSHEEIKRLYKECDLFILPSKRETFGMVFLEALACGLPVLQSEGVGLDGYFPGQSFYMTARCEEEFVVKIYEFYNSRHEVKANLRKFLEKNKLEQFSTASIKERYVTEINSIFIK